MHIIAPQVLAQTALLAQKYATGKPYSNVVLEDFFAADFARALVDEFPVNSASFKSERFGVRGKKAYRRDLTALGGAYATIDAVCSSPEFLAWLERLTGINGLTYDPTHDGGGTQEGFDGYELLPHLDANHHPVTKLHRRINLIVYLNEEWRSEWGGGISLYDDPHSSGGRKQSTPPLFNRCIVFATDQRSWHGVDRVELPPGEKHRSRKGISLYYYTLEPAANDVRARHSVLYVPQPIRERVNIDGTLSEQDIAEIEAQLRQRDTLLELYRSQLMTRQEQEAAWARGLSILGYARQVGDVSGRFMDGWFGSEAKFHVYVERAVTHASITVRIPEGIPMGTTIDFSSGGVCIARKDAAPGVLSIGGPIHIAAGTTTSIRVEITATANPHRLGIGADTRNLGFMLDGVTFEH